MGTIFKKVKVSDRLPKNRSYVPTINTLGGIDTLYHICNGEFTNSHVSTDTLHYIEAWLEEVELPSKEEIRKESLGFFTEEDIKDIYGDFIEEDSNTFTRGANYILNKLK